MIINILTGPYHDLISYLIMTRTLKHNRMIQDRKCDRLVIPNVGIMDMNLNFRTITLDQKHY
jgi:hypothetical protein